LRLAMLMMVLEPVFARRVPTPGSGHKRLKIAMILLLGARGAGVRARPSAGQRTLARTPAVALRAWLAWQAGTLQALGALEAHR